MLLYTNWNLNHDKEGVWPYLEDDTDAMKLQNLHIYGRYFSKPERFRKKKTWILEIGVFFVVGFFCSGNRLATGFLQTRTVPAEAVS